MPRKVEVTEAQSEAPMPKGAEPSPDAPADSSVLAEPAVEAQPAGEMQSTGEPSLDPNPSAQEESVEVEVGDGDHVPDEATGEPAVADERLLEENREDAAEAEENAENPDEAEASSDEEVLFADSGITVHVALSQTPVAKDQFTGDDLFDVRGESLSPGDTVPLSALPPYLVKNLREGKVAGARIVSASKAEELNREAALVRQMAADTIGVESDMVTEVL